MKIIVASAFRADSSFAHAVNTIKMADGFAKLGHDVTLVCRQPKKDPVSDEDLRQRFGLSSNLSFLQVKAACLGIPLDAHGSFARQVMDKAKRIAPDFAYCRNYIAPVSLSKSGVPTVAESHAHVGNTRKPLRKMVMALAMVSEFKALVTIAPILKDNFVALGVPPEKVHVLADSVDLDLFARPKGFVKKRPKKPLIVYSGQLYDYKGIPTILDAAAMAPEWDFRLVGGHDRDIDRITDLVLNRGLQNVTLTGCVPHSRVPKHLWEADVLLLPPSALHPSARWTSPVKLGEYLASGSPVVATSIPALKDWLKNEEVHFVEPDNPKELCNGISYVLSNAVVSHEITERAYELAKSISYEERCKSILGMVRL